MDKKARFFILTTFLFMFFLFPQTGYTQTLLTDNQIISILNLITSFGASQETANNVENALRGSETQVKLINRSDNSYMFNHNLSLGDVGEDVRQLQIALNSLTCCTVSITGAGSMGNETQYFGELTKNAVAGFQEFYREDILTPIGLTEGTGYFGSSSRDHLNILRLQPNPISVIKEKNNEPTIDSITPTSGFDGTRVTISGTGFSDSSNTVLTSVNTLRNVPSDSGVIEVDIQSIIPDERKKYVLPIDVYIIVQVEGINSNSAVFVLRDDSLDLLTSEQKEEYKNDILELLPQEFLDAVL